MIEKVTTYGLPTDPFVRVVEIRRLEGETLHVERTVYARAYAPAVSCAVKVDATEPPCT